MVRIGLISYPLYLWHWPLLSYLDILRNGVSNVLEIWAAVLAAVVLSVLTYLYVERLFGGALTLRPSWPSGWRASA